MIHFTEALFWRKVRMLEAGCWDWKGRLVNGYGVMKVGKRTYNAHRLSAQIAYGPCPAGAGVRHICNRRSCVRPSHLRYGTQKENVQDMVLAGRQATGERNGNSKLKAKQVQNIRRSYFYLGRTQAELARKFKVTVKTIWNVVRRQTWR